MKFVFTFGMQGTTDGELRNLLEAHLTEDVDNHEVIFEGLDQSYYFEGLPKKSDR